MLHLLNVTLDKRADRITLKGFDDESKQFVHDFQEDHPHGLVSKQGESLTENAVALLQALEGDAYVVVSISESETPGGVFWKVWYRNKQKPARIDGSRSGNPRVRELRISK